MSERTYVMSNEIPANWGYLTAGKFYLVTDIETIMSVWGNITDDNGEQMTICLHDTCFHLANKRWSVFEEVVGE